MTKSVGVIGMGMLGTAVARRLLYNGYDVFVYNRTAQKASGVASEGCTLLSSPKEVAKSSDVIITVVRDGAAVHDVSFGTDGIIRGCDKTKIVADMSTISPIDSIRIHRQYGQGDVAYLGTPVMGGPDAAAEGNLVLIADGDYTSFQRVQDVFDTLCHTIHHVGKSGTAHAVKLCMNMQIASLAVSLSEGITLARALDIPPETFLKILNSTYFGTGMSKRKALKMIKSQYPATFTLENLTKDLGMIRDAAKSSGIHLDMSDMILDLYERAVSDGLGDLDYTGILEAVGKNAKPDVQL